MKILGYEYLSFYLKRRAPKTPNLRPRNSKQKGNGRSTRQRGTRTATVRAGRDSSPVNEVDIPTSPMLMRESDQSGVETPRDNNETLPSPHHRGNGVNVLIRTQNSESTDVTGRRATAGILTYSVVFKGSDCGSWLFLDHIDRNGIQEQPAATISG
ncbi:hypothetical protein ANCCAN_18756, partial [Ancylostoma caninum]